MNCEGRTRVLSEREIARNGFKFLRFGLEGCFMDGVAVNEDRLVWFGRACIFTGPATDANIILHFRDKEVSFKSNHMTRLCGAVFRTGAASRFLGAYDAVILYEDSLAQLCQLLGFHHQGHDGTCWAYIGTAVAVIVAKPPVEVHPGLHDTGKAIFTHRRLNDICRAGVDAERAGRASGGKRCYSYRTGW